MAASPGEPRGADARLVLLVAFTAVASLSAAGALLATTLIVVPAATTRLLTDRLLAWQAATVALAAVEGVGGLWLASSSTRPPGPASRSSAARSSPAPRSGACCGRGGGRAPGGAARRPAIALLAACALAGCATGAASDGRVKVVATTTQLADIAREVAGRSADVRGLLRPGATRTLRAAARRSRGRARADVVLTSGLGLDDWAHELIDAAGGDARVIDVGAPVPIRRRTDNGDFDPHWWHDPRNAIAASRTAERAIERAGAPRAALDAQRPRLPRAPARTRRAHRGLHGARAAAGAKARHRPRCARLLRRSLRPRRRRCRLPGAVDPGAGRPPATSRRSSG